MGKAGDNGHKSREIDLVESGADQKLVVPIKKLLVQVSDGKEENQLDERGRFHENIKNQRVNEQPGGIPEGQHAQRSQDRVHQR